MRKLAEIRYRLKMDCTEFRELLGIKFKQELSRYERKNTIINPALAKHILESVRKAGLNMTLDEFYDDVKPAIGVHRSRREETYEEIIAKRDARERSKISKGIQEKKEFFKELKELDVKKLTEKSAGVTKVKYDPIVIS